ncbi:TIGR04282 family arsenosugar biosynthesis glycosyltransferase [Parvularcula dongshanensis]|uniref:Glycosyltransferase n=1 Tax=Parvularcula dongshanensis TaxID=1173995 RepID=A0A840I1J2_9PROT|nr:hypothetical protein [Parvularcula dongshanensis]
MSVTPQLVLFAKPPLAGRVKTRLAKDVGSAFATSFYRQATARLLRRLADPRWRTVLCADAPPGVGPACWPPGVRRIAQGGGNLGDRMRRALRRLPPGPVVILGTDAPQVTRADVAAAFAALRGADLVVGPAEDGGYWLIGASRRRPLPGLFEGVRWSTKHALGDTLASLPGDARVAHLRTLRDVDDGEDLKALRSTSP